jgi:V-type H+-transporting ATPase subunit a
LLLFAYETSYPDCGNCTTTPAVRKDPHRTYEFGVDPAWKGSANNLNYYNSLKMKMSVIFGVVQMSVGIFLSLLNGIHFHSKINIFCEFLPQILFLLCIFGYMCFLIFFKWATVWTSTPPFLLNVMIQMFLHPQGVQQENLLFEGQVNYS